MQINSIDFILEAEEIYRKNPAEFGFAFWKYRELIKTAEAYRVVLEGYRHLYAIKDNKLVYYWSQNKTNMAIPMNRLLTLDLLFVHAGYINALKGLEQTHNIHECNALIYNNTFIDTNECNHEYYVDNFNFNDNNDYIQAANIINSADGWGGMTADRIKAFTELPVFDKDLWVFIKHVNTNIPASIGICIHDDKTNETELEWIYVDKNHQRRKIGRMLISEIVRRAIDKSKTIRIGGVADDFYIKCGFNLKTEKWLWITKKDTKVGWWEN